MSTSKTTTKKAVAKKVAAPKTKTAASKKRTMVVAKGSHCFWVNQGPILKDLEELADALKTMSEKMFAHHVNKDHNDFADWVEGVLKDADAATALRKAKKPKTAYTAVIKYVKLYDL
jgi:hypothetical protein